MRFDHAAAPAMVATEPADASAIDVTDLLVAVEERASVPAPASVEVPVSLSRMPRVVVSSTSLPAARPSGTYETRARTPSDERIEPNWTNASSLPPTMSRAPVAPLPPAPTKPPAPPVAPPSAAPPSVSTAEEESRLLAQVITLKKIPRLRVSGEALTKLPLDHRAGFVITLIDGTSSIEDLIDASGMSRLDVLRVVVSLIGRGVVALS
jgi:hypothetical protein